MLSAVSYLRPPGDLIAPDEPCVHYPVGRTFTLWSDAVGL